MPIAKLKEYLDTNEIQYVTISHSKAYTATQAAESAHVQGKDLAKAVVLKMDGKLAMAVLPATRKVHLDRLRKGSGCGTVELAHEQDFQGDFPGCEPGAIPPFGNLFQMEVFVEPRLSEDQEIAFSAGTHSELIRMKYQDFARLVKPRSLPM